MVLTMHSLIFKQYMYTYLYLDVSVSINLDPQFGEGSRVVTSRLILVASLRKSRGSSPRADRVLFRMMFPDIRVISGRLCWSDGGPPLSLDAAFSQQASCWLLSWTAFWRFLWSQARLILKICKVPLHGQHLLKGCVDVFALY